MAWRLTGSNGRKVPSSKPPMRPAWTPQAIGVRNRWLAGTSENPGDGNGPMGEPDHRWK